MIKLRIPTFTIKPASKSKRESKPTGSNISRKCYAVVKEIDGEFKAVINIAAILLLFNSKKTK